MLAQSSIKVSASTMLLLLPALLDSACFTTCINTKLCNDIANQGWLHGWSYNTWFDAKQKRSRLGCSHRTNGNLGHIEPAFRGTNTSCRNLGFVVVICGKAAAAVAAATTTTTDGWSSLHPPAFRSAWWQAAAKLALLWPLVGLVLMSGTSFWPCTQLSNRFRSGLPEFGCHILFGSKHVDYLVKSLSRKLLMSAHACLRPLCVQYVQQHLVAPHTELCLHLLRVRAHLRLKRGEVTFKGEVAQRHSLQELIHWRSHGDP